MKENIDYYPFWHEEFFLPLITCKCGWEGNENELDQYTFNDDRWLEYYCPECENKIQLT